ncbi:rhomboid-like protein 14, mitochondrial [Primulina huaijiensis]|uniref:rhomboid-like protein 14, mitochondrial n=1 Tax=Primulina huaijiensis TaxID=1492673 RepID=UPI003CC76A09
MDGGRGKGRMLALLLVQAFGEYWRLDRKPPVTAGLVAANTLIYLRPRFLQPILPTINQVWFNPYLILKHKDLNRFLFSAFYHVSESHLFYNMSSLLWKGIQLETAMGSVKFAAMVASLVGMSQGITLLLAKAALLFDYERFYYNEYSAGFSGVLFAMKVVLYSEGYNNYTYVHGLMVPARYAAWAELILIQMFVPGVSFLGHLGGVLAGLLYLYLKSLYSGPNPLLRLISNFTGVLSWPLRYMSRMMSRSSRSRISGRGTLGRSGVGNVAGLWRCQSCTFDNSGLLSECEMCGMGRYEGESPRFDDHDAWTLPPEELRQRRIDRFGR